MKWDDRYFARDFDTSKNIPAKTIRELSRVVLKVPSFVTQHDHYWALLRTTKPMHRELVRWLVKNIYYDHNNNGMIEHFGQLLDAPYVLHSFVCNGSTHNLSENIKKISSLHNSFKLEWTTFVKSFDQIETALDDAKDKLEDYKGTRKKALQRIVDQMDLVEDFSETEEK